MQRKIIFLFIVALSLIVSGCGEDGGSEGGGTTAVVQGWHFQGRDCLACHNVDLGPTRHLLIGGTLYKSKTVSNKDDLNSVCGGNFIINFLDTNRTNTVPLYSSALWEDPNSKGYKAKGNLFILSRKLPQFTANSSFIMQIKDKNSSIILAESVLPHNFTINGYNINNPADSTNRVSCNSCHIKDGSTYPLAAPLYVKQTAVSLCK